MNFALVALVVILGLLFITVLGCIYLLFWNEHISRVRQNLIDQVAEAGWKDVRRGDDFQWRWAAYESVSYRQMMLHPWRKPLSLYENLDFIDPSIHNPAVKSD